MKAVRVTVLRKRLETLKMENGDGRIPLTLRAVL